MEWLESMFPEYKFSAKNHVLQVSQIIITWIQHAHVQCAPHLFDVGGSVVVSKQKVYTRE